MVFFPAKPGWESPRKSENKIIIQIISYPSPYRELNKKIAKKFKKQKNPIMALFSSQNRLGKAEKEWQ